MEVQVRSNNIKVAKSNHILVRVMETTGDIHASNTRQEVEVGLTAGQELATVVARRITVNGVNGAKEISILRTKAKRMVMVLGKVNLNHTKNSFV